MKRRSRCVQTRRHASQFVAMNMTALTASRRAGCAAPLWVVRRSERHVGATPTASERGTMLSLHSRLSRRADGRLKLELKSCGKMVAAPSCSNPMT
jgi:hypothetical protein